MRLPRVLRGTAFRFSVLHTLVFVLLVALIGAVAEVTVTRALERQAQDRVEGEAATLADDFSHEGLDGLKDALAARLRARSTRLRYAVVGQDRRTILGDEGLSAYAGEPGVSRAAGFQTVADDPGDVVVATSRALSGGLHLVVADDLESVEDVQHVVSGAFFLAFVLAVVLGLGAGAFLTRSLLHRVDAITRTADAIIAGDLRRRMVLQGSGDDFDRLSSTLNAMLDRITGLMDNLRQVSSDVAHDLRTPLSRLRQGLEDSRLRAGSAADYEVAVDKAITEADGLLDTFSALLRIAEIESEARRAAFTRVDLSEVVRRVAEAFAPVAEDEARAFRIDVADGLAVEGDRDLLAQAIANLIENALHHTQAGTAIAVGLRRTPDGGVLAEVADEGLGVPAGERERIFRRFYRLERSRTSPGNGLGLSLVLAIAELHHASVEALDNAPGLRIAIRLNAHVLPGRDWETV